MYIKSIKKTLMIMTSCVMLAACSRGETNEHSSTEQTGSQGQTSEIQGSTNTESVTEVTTEHTNTPALTPEATESETATEAVTEVPDTVDTSAGNEPVTIVIDNLYTQSIGPVDGWLGELLEKELGIKVVLTNDVLGSVTSDADMFVVIECDMDTLKETAFDWSTDNILNEEGEEISAKLPESLIIVDGGCYGIALDNLVEGTVTSFSDTWNVNWKLYKEAGKPVPKDLDEFAEMLINMSHAAEDDMPGMGLTDTFIDGAQYDVLSLAASYYGLFNMGGGLYDPVTDMPLSLSEDGGAYYNILRFVNGLYRLGLIEERIDLSINEYWENVYAGKYLFVPGVSAVEQTGGMYLPVIPEEAVTKANSIKPVQAFAIINKDSAHARECVKLLNYLASENGAVSALYGPRGVCWELDEDGRHVLTETGYELYNRNRYPEVGEKFAKGENTLLYMQVFHNNSLIPGYDETFNYSTWNSAGYADTTDSEKEWLDTFACRSIYDYLVNIRKPVIQDVEYDHDPQVLTTETGGAVCEKTWECIFAEDEVAFEAAWKELKSEM